MADFLNQDFGSESEDDNFNPAPADESDNEAQGDLEDDINVQQPTGGYEQPRRRSSPSMQFQQDAEPTDEDRSSPGPMNGTTAQRLDNEEEDDDAEGSGEDIVDGEGDDDEDDEDDDEDEEEAITSRPRKKRRRDPRNQYIDVEAEVDEDEEGDEEDEEGQDKDFIAETHPDDLAELPAGAETDDRRHRELDRQRERMQQMDAEKQAEILKERYGRSRAQASDQAAAVPKRLLLPSVEDPGIWGVKCKPGKEREVVFSILKRIEERARQNIPSPIISAFERGTSMAGRVYIECAKQADILNSLADISNVYPRSSLLLVEIKERPDLLRVRKTKDLQPGGYVRIKRGKYQGDLAQIDGVEANDTVLSLRIVPRLSYGQGEDTNSPMITNGPRGDTQKRKRAGAIGLNTPANRPPQRLFNENEAKKKHARNLQSLSTLDKKHWMYLGDTYINGYLIKDMKIQHLITEGVNPTLEEVTKFAAGSDDGTENLDLSALAQTLKNASSSENYLPGDMVEVFEGEQQGAIGKALNVRGDIVTLTVSQGELKGQRVEIPTKSLRKVFKEGDHVKVIGGKYRDEVGMVVRLKRDTVTILSDLNMQEITVFNKDLREASDSGVAGGLGLYDIHDLVQLDASTVACVTKVDRESLRVLDQNGSVRTVMPSQISNKLERRRNAVSTDRNGSEIRNDDTVRESGGESRQGSVLHIYRSFLFVHNREQTENSGISALRSSNVVTVAAKGGRVAQTNGTGPDLAKMNPAMMKNGMNGTNSMPPPKTFGRDRAIGQTVTVRKGPYKGLLGIVKDTTDAQARVELHTKGKTITVAKDTLAFKDPLTGASIDYTRFTGARGGRGDGGRGGYSGMNGSRMSDYSAPSGSRTPAGSGSSDRVPAWGSVSSRTPAWGANSSSRTPAYVSDTMAGARTPAYGRSTSDSSRPSYSSSTADGSRTAYGGGAGDRTAYGGTTSGFGSRTPAWGDTSSRTPAHTSNTSSNSTSNGPDPFAPSARTPYHDPFSSSSRTPAYEPPAARTPAYASSNTNNDPWASTFANPPQSVHASHRPYDAPTPSAPKDAPTPAYGASAPTPSASAGMYNAATPAAGAGASTPAAMGDGGGGGYNAPTPAATAAVAHTPRYEAYAGDAPTPYGGGVAEAQTPAAMGGDDEDVDGPGYEEGTPSP